MAWRSLVLTTCKCMMFEPKAPQLRQASYQVYTFSGFSHGSSMAVRRTFIGLHGCLWLISWDCPKPPWDRHAWDTNVSWQCMAPSWRAHCLIFSWRIMVFPMGCHGILWHFIGLHRLPQTVVVLHGIAMGVPRVSMAMLWGVSRLVISWHAMQNTMVLVHSGTMERCHGPGYGDSMVPWNGSWQSHGGMERPTVLTW